MRSLNFVFNSVDRDRFDDISDLDLSFGQAAERNALNLNLLDLVYLTRLGIVLGPCRRYSDADSDEDYVNAVVIGIFLVVVDDIFRNVSRNVRGDRIADIIDRAVGDLCVNYADKLTVVVEKTAARVSAVNRGVYSHNSESGSSRSVNARHGEVLAVNVNRADRCRDSDSSGVSDRDSRIEHANVIRVRKLDRNCVACLENVAALDLEHRYIVVLRSADVFCINSVLIVFLTVKIELDIVADIVLGVRALVINDVVIRNNVSITRVLIKLVDNSRACRFLLRGADSEIARRCYLEGAGDADRGEKCLA